MLLVKPYLGVLYQLSCNCKYTKSKLFSLIAYYFLFVSVKIILKIELFFIILLFIGIVGFCLLKLCHANESYRLYLCFRFCIQLFMI